MAVSAPYMPTGIRRPVLAVTVPKITTTAPVFSADMIVFVSGRTHGPQV